MTNYFDLESFSGRAGACSMPNGTTDLGPDYSGSGVVREAARIQASGGA